MYILPITPLLGVDRSEKEALCECRSCDTWPVDKAKEMIYGAVCLLVLLLVGGSCIYHSSLLFPLT